MGYRFDVFVGSDNDSRKIRKGYLDRVVSWANSVFPEGYTLTRGRGYFGGTEEDSLILSVLTNHRIDIREKIESLKAELGQRSILVTNYTVELENV